MTEGLEGAPLAVVALGGNLGDTEAHFHRALRSLARHGSHLRVAPLYRTPPSSSIPQPDFLNTVAALRSHLDAEDLLALGKRLELEAGRRPGARFGPRPLDVDLLLFGDRSSHAPELEIPHPALRSRRFVLAPLCDLLPGLLLPPDGTPVSELLEGLESSDWIEEVRWRRRP